MYEKMKGDEILAIAAHPDHYSDYQRKCAIHNLNNAINHNKIIIKQYKEKIELIKSRNK